MFEAKIVEVTFVKRDRLKREKMINEVSMGEEICSILN